MIAIVLGAVGVYLTRSSFPRTSGEVKLSGLDSPVDIYRDSYGIPQIYAKTPHDLFFAQGYVHAQDRFWQMDFWRHIGSGRLSEMFGKNQAGNRHLPAHAGLGAHRSDKSWMQWMRMSRRSCKLTQMG